MSLKYLLIYTIYLHFISLWSLLSDIILEICTPPISPRRSFQAVHFDDSTPCCANDKWCATPRTFPCIYLFMKKSLTYIIICTLWFLYILNDLIIMLVLIIYYILYKILLISLSLLSRQTPLYQTCCLFAVLTLNLFLWVHHDKNILKMLHLDVTVMQITRFQIPQ